MRTLKMLLNNFILHLHAPGHYVLKHYLRKLLKLSHPLRAQPFKIELKINWEKVWVLNYASNSINKIQKRGWIRSPLQILSLLQANNQMTFQYPRTLNRTLINRTPELQMSHGDRLCGPPLPPQFGKRFQSEIGLNSEQSEHVPSVKPKKHVDKRKHKVQAKYVSSSSSEEFEPSVQVKKSSKPKGASEEDK